MDKKISRKGFLKIAAATAMSGVTAGALAACEAGSSSVAASSAAAASGTYIPGTYSAEATGIGANPVKVTMTFDAEKITDVQIDVSGETAGYGADIGDEMIEKILSAQSSEVDGHPQRPVQRGGRPFGRDHHLRRHQEGGRKLHQPGQGRGHRPHHLQQG